MPPHLLSRLSLVFPIRASLVGALPLEGAPMDRGSFVRSSEVYFGPLRRHTCRETWCSLRTRALRAIGFLREIRWTSQCDGHTNPNVESRVVFQSFPPINFIPGRSKPKSTSFIRSSLAGPNPNGPISLINATKEKAPNTSLTIKGRLRPGKALPNATVRAPREISPSLDGGVRKEYPAVLARVGERIAILARLERADTAGAGVREMRDVGKERQWNVGSFWGGR